MGKTIVAMVCGLLLPLLFHTGLLFTGCGVGPVMCAAQTEPLLSPADTPTIQVEEKWTDDSAEALSTVPIDAETRFVDNGDDTVTDRKTGLMWLKTGRPTFGAMTWQDALTYCNQLEHGGYTDWHVPSTRNWMTIISRESENPALVRADVFRNVVTYLGYWSRTELESSPGYAWMFNLYYGKGTLLNKSKTAFAWPVRQAHAVAVQSKGELDASLSAVAQGTYLTEELQTRYLIIRFRQVKDLAELDRKIKVSPALTGTYASAADLFGGPLKQRLALKMDALFTAIQEMLDMRKRMEKVAVHVYPNPELLNATQSHPPGAGGRIRHVIYDYPRNTIGISARNINTRSLGHHLALAIIDHFMPVRPPLRSAKIMAAYVDQQLAE